MDELIPILDASEIDHVAFGYDAGFDVGTFHLQTPRPGTTEEVAPGWYLRLADSEAGDAGVPDGTVLGLECHGFRRDLLTHPVFARLLRPAVDELARAAGSSLENDVWVEAPAEALTVTTRALLVLLGYALALWHASMREEYAEAFESYLKAAKA